MNSNMNFDVSIFSDGPVCVMRWSGEDGHRVLAATPNAHLLLGYTDQEFLSGTVDYAELIHPEDTGRVHVTVDAHVESKRAKGFSDEYRVKHKNGNYVWVSDHTQLKWGANGEWLEMVGYITDISERKALREEVTTSEVARKLAEASARSKSEFLANMSHEIRTPLNGIMGMAQVLSQMGLPKDQMEIVDVIQQSSEALRTVINDILDFSKMEAGQVELDLQPFNIRKCIEDVAKLLITATKNSGVDLIVDVDTSLPVNYIGDVSRIRQILMNLVGNAAKFTHQGHILIHASGKRNGNAVDLEIRISDTGIGIAEDKLQGIFEQFTQADNTTTRTYGGTGLGLSISRKLAVLMGGDLSVESVLGSGSTFTLSVSLPTVVDSPNSRDSPSPDIRGNILIVDDNAVNCEVLTKQLSSDICNCVSVCSVPEAISFLNKAREMGARIDLIITDYQMPQHNGETLIRQIRAEKNYDHIAIIMLTSVDHYELKDKVLSLGASACLTKPARLNDLKSEVSRALNS